MVVKSKATLVQVKDLTSSVKHFVFELEEEFSFTAGQFVNISFRDGETKYRKPYSIASNPTNENNRIEFCIKLVENGVTTPVLWKKTIGSEVEIMGPLGLFTCEHTKKNDLLFIGTGTGVAPLRSMIKDLLKNKTTKTLTLLLGIRYENEILYEEEFEELMKNNPNFKFIKVISKPTTKWFGRIGHVHQNLEGINVLNSEAFICGLPIMVEETNAKLIELGMDPHLIHHEKYV